MVPTYTVGQPENFHWGVGAYLRDAEGATGQTPSSDRWDAIAASILRGQPVPDEPRVPHGRTVRLENTPRVGRRA